MEHRALIGREIPLRVLSDALAAPPAVVLLSGEAGIGKTRLVTEVEAASELVLHGECIEFGGEELAFAPVVAGIGKMSRKTFISFNVIGAFIWVFGVTLAGYALADAIGDSIDKYLYPLIAVIIIVSLIPPFIEWRKAKKQAPRNYTQAQVEAEAAALHEVVEED